MDSSPSQTLKELLAEIIEWIQISDGKKEEKMIPCLPCLSMPSVSEEKQEAFAKLNWPRSFSAIVFLRDHVVPHLGGIHIHLISVVCRRFCQNHLWTRRLRFNSQNFKQVAEMLDSFFKELFQLPKLHLVDVDDTLIKYHLPEDFLRFLGEFLIYEKRLLSSFGLDKVLKELKYLVPIFRDRPFQAVEYKVQCLWEHFEGLINKAGRFVHSFFFYPNLLDRKFCETLSVSIDLLKDSIIEFISTLPNFSNSVVVYHDVDSFFIIPSLLNDLEDLVNQSHGPIVDIKDQIGGLHQRLKLSWSLLKEHIEIKEFKEIAVQVRDIAYGVEYMINSFLAGETHVWYVKLSLTTVIHHIKLIGHQLLEMKERSDDWALRSVSNTFADKLLMQDRRSGIEVNDIIVGFQEEEQSILEQLLGGTRSLQRIGIVGTPGLGKTTLARKLHSHPAVCDRFDRRSWCVVSQRYQRKHLLVDILKGLGEEVKPNMDEASLALQIHKTIKYRRYLITLDDIWNLDAWDDVQSCFPDDKNGSRILFTSRNEDASPSGSLINYLPFLSNDQCWELIRKLVFRGKTCPPMLKETGKKISAKCKGLPLVVTVIAGILSTVDKELEEWEKVGQDVQFRDFVDQNEQVIEMLEFSYRHLLQQLKPCFLYFATFREHEKISAKKLKQLWVAEGFIEEGEQKKKSVESIAEEYLMELINKSLVMVLERGSDGKVKTCGIHDLLHSMCLRIAEEEKFLKRVDRPFSPEYLKFNRLLFLFPPRYESMQLCSLRFRSIFLDHERSHSLWRLPFVEKTPLRVLDDQSHQNRYGNCYSICLRYLEVVSGDLLNSIGSLPKLEYLILHKRVVYIPSEIRKMPKLRYLKARKVMVDDDCEIPQLPNNLEYLSALWISNHKFIQLLKSTPHLRRLKCYFGDGFCPGFDLCFLTQLESLSVSFSGGFGVGFQQQFEEGMKFPGSIRKLSILGLPYSWRYMSMIGALPNLEVLKLEDDACSGYSWNTSDSEFKKLRYLELHSLDLCQWNISSGGCFPCLQQIVLDRLYSLQKIPREIGEIQTLQLIKVSRCLNSVAESAKEIEQEQHEFGNEDLTVIMEEIWDEYYKNHLRQQMRRARLALGLPAKGFTQLAWQ